MTAPSPAGPERETVEALASAIEQMLQDEIEQPGPLDSAWLALWVMDLVKPYVAAAVETALRGVLVLADEWRQATDCVVGPDDEGAQRAWRSARRELMAAIAAATTGESHG